MTSVKENNEELVIFFLEHGADTEYEDYTGRTALDKAELFGRENIIRILLWNYLPY